MVVNRLGRLLPGKGRWPLLAFRADNTLREPPMRVLPNGNLQRLESMSESGSAAGAVFHVSGEVHQYRGAQYLLIRNVIRKRSMDEF